MRILRLSTGGCVIVAVLGFVGLQPVRILYAQFDPCYCSAVTESASSPELSGSNEALLAGDKPGAQPLYLDPSQPIELRVRDLVARLTLEEKAAMMRNTTPGVPRLGIPKYDWWNEALHGVARAGEATVFPQAIGLAAMWDEQLLQQIASVIGVEARAKFNAVKGTEKEGARYYGLTFWSPNINIFRDPRWGRGQETYGEDPFLTARMGVAFVRGLQGNHPKYLQAAACAKHFAVHSGPERLRHNFDVAPPEADLYETYLPAFEALVKEAKVEGVMTAYNSLYGTPCTINSLLFSLLRKWGFEGYVTSDCGAVEDLERTYKLAADAAEAQALAAKAGVDVRCGSPAPALVEAVQRGLVDEAVLDKRVGALLRTMFRLGFFDPKESVVFNFVSPSANNAPEHQALALKAAQQSLVLLKNDGLLPVDPAKFHRVAVIGPNANSIPALLGNYCGTPVAPVTILAGIRARFGPAVQVDYSLGCDYAAPPPGLRPIPRSALRVGDTPGLIAHYFDNPQFSGREITRRRERRIELDFRKYPPPKGVPSQNVSVYWEGDLLTTLAGQYEFVVRARGGVRLTLAGKRVIDDWTAGQKTLTAVELLPERARVPIKLEYFADGTAQVSLEWQMPHPETGYAAAIALAKEADLIIFVGGLSPEIEGEQMEVDYEGFDSGDRTRIELPAVQERLLQKLIGLKKPVVYVNLSGSPIAMSWADKHVNAIVQAWYPGQAGGTAVAGLLCGDFNPAGRLPITFPRATSHLPEFEDYRMESGRTYRYLKHKPLYPFGYGLSYTKFRYANLRVSRIPDGALLVSVDVTNIGKRDGEEVVQIYAKPPHARERIALCGFKRIPIATGQTETVTITVPLSALRRWDTTAKDYTVPRGKWHIYAGASSEDLRLHTTIQIR